MAETFGWVFVEHIPLLYEKDRVAKQLQIEKWLDLTQLARELGIEEANGTTPETNPTKSYIA